MKKSIVLFTLLGLVLFTCPATAAMAKSQPDPAPLSSGMSMETVEKVLEVAVPMMNDELPEPISVQQAIQLYSDAELTIQEIAGGGYRVAYLEFIVIVTADDI